ncbi:chaperonin 10-like protein [Boeremia exigua]|uniref:chaperonin 10-like protein n=1 Tax=Boeremia exigua TaxID=749465 RepID=UPI001E8E8950|nr:chaperonin 10-like protein [Boeremia exigua]KAH6642112.1 chaperonin 10-like protein [Boeremia exigua]
MRAARYYGKEDIRIEDDVAEAQCGAGQVRVAPAYVGICGSDLHEYIGGPTFAPTTPHPLTHDSIPITLGHEFSGVITELGPDVTAFTLGQHCVVQPTLSCTTCPPCLAGAENVCHGGGFIGLSGGGGGLSDHVVVAASAIVPLPTTIPLDVGALVEPLAVAWHAVAAAPVTPDSTALVLGGGPIGLAIVQCLRAQGVRSIVLSEPSGARQRFARALGAHHVLDPRGADVVAETRALSGGGGGADVVFDCAGVAASLDAACKAVRARGTIVNVAIWEKPVPWSPNSLVWNEARFTAVLGYRRADFEAVVDGLTKGTLKPEAMITSKIALDDLVKEGFEKLIHDKENHVKILVDMGMLNRTDSAVH